MKKILTSLLVLCSFISAYAQTDYKQVYDKSLENQIISSVGVNSEWQFSPGWYYDFLHRQYKSRQNEDNNMIPLKNLIEAAEKSFLKVHAAHEAITVVYNNEMKHWLDRTSDREINDVLNDIENAKYAIQVLTSNFSINKVPVNEAERIYDEYNRINQKYFLIGDTVRTHMDNQKRRRTYAVCLDEFKTLINVCYHVNWFCFVASKQEDFIEIIKKDSK
jgi:hypothetical protein